MNKLLKSIIITLMTFSMILSVSYASVNVSDDESITEVDLETTQYDDEETDYDADEAEAELDQMADEAEEELDQMADEAEEELDQMADEAEEELDEMADEAEEDLTDEETKIISTPLGAQVRLYQLQKAVEQKIIGAEIIIEDLENNNATEEEIERLYEILEEYKIISSTISSMNMEQSADILASEFVALKNEAIELTQEFRQSVAGKISDEAKEELKEEIEDRRDEIKDNIKERIENAKKRYNVAQTLQFINGVGLNSTELRQKLQTGELNEKEIREMVRNSFSNLTDEEKREVIQKAKETRNKALIKAKDKKEELEKKIERRREEIRNRIEERREEIENRIEQKREEIKNRVEEKRQELKEKIEEKREEIQKKAEERRKNINDGVEDEAEDEAEDTMPQGATDRIQAKTNSDNSNTTA